MAVIYHITSRQEWETGKQKGAYEASSLKEEGFIHCSEENQVAGVLDRYFRDKKDLIKLKIETTKLKSQLIYEWSSTSAETFPHIYGPININAVINVEPIP